MNQIYVWGVWVQSTHSAILQASSPRTCVQRTTVPNQPNTTDIVWLTAQHLRFLYPLTWFIDPSHRPPRGWYYRGCTTLWDHINPKGCRYDLNRPTNTYGESISNAFLWRTCPPIAWPFTVILFTRPWFAKIVSHTSPGSRKTLHRGRSTSCGCAGAFAAASSMRLHHTMWLLPLCLTFSYWIW